MMLDHLRRMALYNRWANQHLYDACGQLGEKAYHKPRNMFFSSIHGTLNHILVGDRLWLSRIEQRPTPPSSIDHELYSDLAALGRARHAEDEHMIEVTDRYDESDLGEILHYRTLVNPSEISTPLHLCWLHLFNHQTHHRGQIHDQLSQTEIAPPSLDLIFYLREVG